jgi:hypothetical protein
VSPDEEDLIVTEPEGRFRHEIPFPFVCWTVCIRPGRSVSYAKREWRRASEPRSDVSTLSLPLA